MAWGHGGAYCAHETSEEGSGAPGEIRTPDPQVRRLVLLVSRIKNTTKNQMFSRRTKGKRSTSRTLAADGPGLSSVAGWR